MGADVLASTTFKYFVVEINASWTVFMVPDGS